ncbi:MAG: methyltransferase domain-containing protein [Bacteroides sp.]|nr:methyltransferase domain-containing protein [Bacteroides sp.]
MGSAEYVHGYTERETQRLQEQSLILEELLHSGTSYPAGSRVLEVGCGVGAQTLILLRRNPGIHLTSIDMSEASVLKAKERVEEAGFEGVEFRHENIFDHGLAPGSYNHVFVCFVLEHLEEPVQALEQMMKLLKAGGTITLIEGDHSSGRWTPKTAASRAAWDGLVTSQEMLGHDPNIGKALLPLMQKAGIYKPHVKPLEIYADQSAPDKLDGAINQIIAPMVYSAEKYILKNRLVDPDIWKQGLEDLSAVATHREGTFFYSWFKGVGSRPKL